jgi:hypothetical protein
LVSRFVVDLRSTSALSIPHYRAVISSQRTASSGRSVGGPHFSVMPDDLPPPPSVRIRRCSIHAGRYRWDIIEGGRPVASASESFATKDEAEAAGFDELAKLALGATDKK